MCIRDRIGADGLRLDAGFSGSEEALMTYNPVSYTHLDVYKRQLSYNSFLFPGIL